MEELFLARQRIIGVYKLNEDKINIAARFLAGALVFYFLGSIAPEAGLSTKRMAAVVIGGVLGAISSPAVFLAVSALGAVLFIASVSVETAVVAFLLFFLLYVFYGRVFPRESLLFIAMLICFKFKVPYVVPILGGIYFGARAVFPSAAAMFVNQISSAVPELIKMSPVSEFSISTMPDTLFNMYTYIFTDGIKGMTGSFFAAGVMVLTVASAWLISSLHIDHEKEIAIIVSAVVTVAGMFLAVIVGGSGFSVFGLPFFVFISAVIAYVIRLFDDLPDYRHTERVKFQDKNYIYYVKAVPKIKIREGAFVQRGSGSGGSED